MTLSMNPERINGRLLLGPLEAKDLSLDAQQTKASTIMRAAAVDWTVSKRPLHLPDGRVMPGGYALVRDDNQRPLAVVGSKYRVNQNATGLSAFDRLVEAGILQGYTNAGTFAGGKLVWIQAQIGGFQVGPDEMQSMLTLTISHGSRMTDRWCPSTTRIVCRNTFMMSRAASNGGLTMRHDANGAAAFDSAVQRIHAAVDAMNLFQRQGQELYRRQMTTHAMRDFAAELMPASEGKASPRLEGQRGKVIDLFENGQGIWGVRGTRWAAFNAVTEYVDHSRPTRRGKDSDGVEDSRLASAWHGTGAALKQRALDLLLA